MASKMYAVIDTNVIVYSIDDKSADKHAKAKRIVCEAVGNSNYIISAQVLNEFASVMFKKPDEEVDDLLSVLEAITAVPVAPGLTRRAVELKSATSCSSSIRCCLRRPRRTDARSSGRKT